MDRVADSIAENEDDEDFDEDEEDISDISDSETTTAGANDLSKRKRELIDELMDRADSDEAFGRVLSELSGYQPLVATETKKKTVSLTIGSVGGSVAAGSNTSTQFAGGSNSNSKKRKPPTSGSRFNRLSALTQAMRTGIISDDEGAGKSVGDFSAGEAAQNNSTIDHFTSGYTDSEDFGFEGEEAELAQLKKVRRSSITGQTGNLSAIPSTGSLINTPSKDDSVVLKVIPVPFDAEGNPILPLSLNMITVHSLGEVVYDRPAYHNKRYILPVGFTTSRSYLSVLSPDGSINYLSTILDNGPAPLYQVSPEGHPELVFQSTSTTGAWAAVAKAAAAVRGKESAPSVSGPDYFGLANPTVSMLIEKLPNSDKCEQYAPKKYEVSNLVGGKSAKRVDTASTSTSTSTTYTNTNNSTGNVTMVDIDNPAAPIESNVDTSSFDIHQNYM